MRCMFCGFFLFKQMTAYEMLISDWSSDVCSSDLLSAADPLPNLLSLSHPVSPPPSLPRSPKELQTGCDTVQKFCPPHPPYFRSQSCQLRLVSPPPFRYEERRVGKE